MPYCCVSISTSARRGPSWGRHLYMRPSQRARASSASMSSASRNDVCSNNCESIGRPVTNPRWPYAAPASRPQEIGTVGTYPWSICHRNPTVCILTPCFSAIVLTAASSFWNFSQPPYKSTRSMACLVECSSGDGCNTDGQGDPRKASSSSPSIGPSSPSTLMPYSSQTCSMLVASPAQ